MLFANYFVYLMLDILYIRPEHPSDVPRIITLTLYRKSQNTFFYLKNNTDVNFDAVREWKREERICNTPGVNYPK